MYWSDQLQYYVFFFFNDTATTEIYTLSLHDALPIFRLDNAEAILEAKNERTASLYLDGLLDTDENRRLEADRTRAELDHQHARREVDRLHLIVRVLEAQARDGEIGRAHV